MRAGVRRPNIRGCGALRHCPRAFTLVELLVVISIIGVLVSLTLSGVQSAREAARRVQCSNHMKQQALALHAFHAAFNTLPLGNDRHHYFDYSWSNAILPQLEQPAIAERWDRKAVWYDVARNAELAQTVIPTFRCPSSVFDSPGDTDYAGVTGSLLGAAAKTSLNTNNGVLISSTLNRMNPISLTEITDGTSYTIFIAESVDRLPEENGLWASGLNVISHDNGAINFERSNGEIFSLHPSGAQVAMSDGSIRFLSESIDLEIIGGLCTRDSREDLNEFFAH